MKKSVLSALLGLALTAGVALSQEVVRMPPPHALVEHRAARPSGRHVWIAGYHRWDGRAYVWVPGRWELPPRAHAVWVAPRWQHRHGGYIFVEGYWR